jgi:hypothetical protein
VKFKPFHDSLIVKLPFILRKIVYIAVLVLCFKHLGCNLHAPVNTMDGITSLEAKLLNY